MTDLKKLRELAGRADKGPWRWLNCRTLVGDYGSRLVILTSNDFLEVRNRESGLLEMASVDGPNESFIAAANPETVIALLDRIEKLEAVSVAASKVVRLLEDMKEAGYGTGAPESLTDALAEVNHE